MNLTIKYFGSLAEITEQKVENIVVSKILVSDLLEKLIAKYPDLRDKDFQVAQNNEIVTKETLITETEIALLPPFSGG
jgi:molybdopterin synthase sulfur carrier subunit